MISLNTIITYFPNNSHIKLKVCDTASSHHSPSPMNGSNITKLDCILNCCYDFKSINYPYLESSEQLNHFFPDSLHKIKSHIFQNISTYSIQELTPFKYKNACELCDNILYKENIGRLMVNNYCVLCEEVIDVFHNKFYIPTIEKLSFRLAHVRVLGSMGYGRTRNHCLHKIN